MQGLVRAYDWLIQGMRVAAGVVIFHAFIQICLDVLVRLAGFQPWIYASIIVEYSLLWFAMLGAPYLVRIKGHVFIDAVTVMLPPAVKNVTAKLAYLICIVTSAVFVWYSGALLSDAIADKAIDTRAVEIPLWILLLPLPFCFFLVALEFVRYLIGVDSMYGDRTDVKDNV